MKQMICSNCGTIGVPKTVTEGSFFIELILWLCFLIPGLIYSIWRLTKRHQACRTCGSKDLMPLNSPMGIKLQNEFRQMSKR